MKTKKVVAFTIADNANIKYAHMMKNSLRKFHTEEELPLVVYGQEEMDAIQDPSKFYRATPMFARELIKEYDLVIKIDADTIITHDLNHIIDDTSYAVATVMNWNRVDPPVYGDVFTATVSPTEYQNCGFVAMRGSHFIEHWWDMCNSIHFQRTQYKEQDLMNLLIAYAGYQVRFLDYSNMWHGLVAKGTEQQMKLVDGKVIISKDDETGYPTEDITLVAYHFAGGNNNPQKMNYRTMFPEEIIQHFNYLTGDTK